MTQQRRDSHSTEFGLWLREQPEIDSALGYVTSNLDYIWSNHKTGEFMLLEEKRYGTQPGFYQEKLFSLLDGLCQASDKYHGFHVIVFAKTSPDDGGITIDGKDVSKSQLLDFLRFGHPTSSP
jgi:hypothetical protein